MSEFSVIISAGGKSSRIGTDKALVKVGGKTILERIIERTKDLGQAETLLISNDVEKYRQFGLTTYADVFPDKGSLGGIYTGIHYASSPYSLIIACDMPFLSVPLLNYMISLIDEKYELIVPRVTGHPEPLHALYHKTCLEPINKRIEANQLKVMDFYEGLKIRYLDEDEYLEFNPNGTAFMNVNSPEDLAEANRLATVFDSL
jgi:molybdenum cofactor guanylyltransferase